MKKIIRFLSRISGVEKEIRYEERNDIAGSIIGASHWFSDFNKYGAMYPFLTWLGQSIDHQFNIVGTSRGQFDDLQSQPLLDQNGSWKRIHFNSIIGQIEMQDQHTKLIEDEES